MKRKLIIASIILLGILYYYQQTHDYFPFRCDGQITSQVVLPSGDVDLNTYISVIFSGDSSGEMYSIGSVKKGGSDYILHRQNFFSMKKSALKETINVKFTNEAVHPTDTTPDYLWHNIVLPQVNNVGINIEIKPISQNILLIQGLTSPIIICVRPEQ